MALRRRSPSKCSVIEFYAGSVFLNCAYGHDSNLALGRVQVRSYLYVTPVDTVNASGLLTIQILLSLSAVRVLPSLPTLPERVAGFLDIEINAGFFILLSSLDKKVRGTYLGNERPLSGQILASMVSPPATLRQTQSLNIVSRRFVLQVSEQPPTGGQIGCPT